MTNEVAEIIDACPGVEEANVYGVLVPNTDGRAGMAAIRTTDEFDLGVLTDLVGRDLAGYQRPLFLRLLQSEMRLWINRFDYHVTEKWDGALEYRQLAVREAADNSSDGFLLEVNRLMLGHLRLGVGYNFTDVSDDALTANDYEVKGFFFRIQGKY